MKKILFSLGLALGLLGLSQTGAQAQLTELIPWHITTYGVTSTAGAFTDISTHADAVALSTDKTSLYNGVFCATDDIDVTPTFYNDAETNMPDEDGKRFGFPLGFEFNLCGQKMTHFSVSALGGVFFSQGAKQGNHISVQINNGRWGAWAIPFVSDSAKATKTTAVKAGQVVAATGKAPAYYLIEGTKGNHILTTQHDYMVGAGDTKDEWIFQFKFYEATGKVEFIAKQLPCDNALTATKYHRILVSLTDYAATTGSMAIAPADDPYSATYLNVPVNGSNHKVFPMQTDAMSQAGGWNEFDLTYTSGSSMAISLSETATMRVDANGPEEGRTIAFTPKAAPATLNALPETDYVISDLKTTGNTISFNLSLKEESFPSPKALQEAGSIVAVISTSETPDYTLENGVWYQKNHQFASSNNFKPTVICNQMPQTQVAATHKPYGYKIQKPVAVSATGLTGSTSFYIHLYRMSFVGTGAPVYSPLCHTIAARTTFALPKKFETVGLADVNAVKMRVAPTEGCRALVIKSKDLNVTPSGQLKKGDKIGDNAEVLELLDKETTFDVPMAKGEGCFILAFSVNTADPNNYLYTTEKLYLPIGTAYDGMPGLIDFSHLPYGVPNWEYDGANLSDRSFGELEATIYRDLPFGYTRTEVQSGLRDAAFGIGKPAYDQHAAVAVFAKTRVNRGGKVTPLPGMDFITPPVVSDQNRILVTFNTQWLEDNELSGIIPFNIVTSTRDFCTLQYAIGEGAWQTGASFKGHDIVDIPMDEKGYRPLSFSLIAEEGQSFIGQKIRFRFVSTFVFDDKDPLFVAIGSVDIKEDKLCESVKAIVTNDSLTTNTVLSLTWTDPNVPAALSYEVAYRVADDTSASWLTRKANDTAYTINNLNTNTTYAVRVTADCGNPYGKAYASSPAKLSTLLKFPYTESLAQDEPGIIIVNGSPVSVPGPTPFDRGVYSLVGGLPETGYARLGTTEYGWTPAASAARVIDNKNRSTSVGVRETEQAGWLMMPAAFIPTYNTVYPQVIRFKAHCAYRYGSETTWTEGSIGSYYTDAKLYVLLSHNGKFSMADTVATIPVSGATINNQAFEYDVPANLLKDGRAQVAFFFDNPKAFAGDQNIENDYLMLLEIFDFEYVYVDGVCLPVSDLTRENTTSSGATYSWEGVCDHYKFFWGLRSASGYSDSITTKETSYTLSNLKDATTYKVKVVGYCDANEKTVAPGAQTGWFMTFETCHAPANFTVQDISMQGATFISTSDQDIMTSRLISLTPEGGITKLIAQSRTKDTVIVKDLQKGTVYVAKTRSICNRDSSDWSAPITFKTATTDSFNITLKVLPFKTAGSVEGNGRYAQDADVTVKATAAEGYTFVAWRTAGGDTLSTEAVYTFKATADTTLTALFEEGSANEASAAVKDAFNVSTKDGQLIIRNLKGLTVEEVTVYGLTGRQLGYFTPNSREDLALPINAERALLLVRVASEQGVAIYKVYLH